MPPILLDQIWRLDRGGARRTVESTRRIDLQARQAREHSAEKLVAAKDMPACALFGVADSVAGGLPWVTNLTRRASFKRSTRALAVEGLTSATTPQFGARPHWSIK